MKSPSDCNNPSMTGVPPVAAARMEKNATIKCLLTFAAAALLVSGCASPNVNPLHARANTGYVDFHADASPDLSWEVARFDEGTQAFHKVFSELDPPAGGFLRLAFAPGRHRLRITFLNRVISSPAEIEVEVQDGKITPVHVTLTESGTALVDRKTQNVGSSVLGRHGMRTKLISGTTPMYVVAAVADAPAAYQPK
jgi:hypothetical protein